MSETKQKDGTHPEDEGGSATATITRSPSPSDKIDHPVAGSDRFPWDPEGEETEDDARARLGLPPDAPRELLLAADGHEMEDDENSSAAAKEAQVLDFLLGPTVPIEYDVEALVETPGGPEKLIFHFKQLDDATLEALEREHTDGDGPFARVNRRALNNAKVARATVWLEDKDGRKVELSSAEFRGNIPDPSDALAVRFKYQPGILSSVAAEIDNVAGMTNERVGIAVKSEQTASQSMTEAVGNS